jgi:uncharacterized protein YdcH (DUF465 family)
MSHTPHELIEEFPAAAARLTALKADPRFAKLAEAYHLLNRAIHRMETDIEAVADHVIEDAKKERLALKDQIAGWLERAA